MLRLVREIQVFDDLYLMTTAISGSLRSLGWACCLLFVIQMLIALLLTQVLQDSYLKSDRSEAERQKIYEYFGTFTRSMLSMFEITLANWPPVCRCIQENVSQWYTLVFVLHKLIVGF